MKQGGHISMECTAPHDPRQTHVRPTTSPDVGPGAHNLDPLHEHTTAIAHFEPGQSHHMVAYSKDPTRESPAFRSPHRDETASALTEERRRMSCVSTMLPPDYKTWTAKGCYTSTQPRMIEADRWGPSLREPRPPTKDRNQKVYEFKVTTSGSPASCQHYAQDSKTPKYKVPFGSRLPRLSALPANSKQDTRISPTLHPRYSTTAAELGPGSYASDLPQYVSHHSAYEGKQVYYSLAASPTSPSNLEQQEAPWGKASPRSPRGPPALRRASRGDDAHSRAQSSLQAEVDAQAHPHTRLHPHHQNHPTHHHHTHPRAPVHGHAPQRRAPAPMTSPRARYQVSSRPTTPGSQTRILESPVPLPLYAPSNAVTRIGSPTSAAAAAARIGSPKGGRRLSGRLSTPPLVNSGSGGLNAGAGGNSSAAQQQQQQQQQQLQASAPGVPEVVVRVSGGLGQLMDLEAEAKQASGSTVTPLTVPESRSCSQALSPGDPSFPAQSPDRPFRTHCSSVEEGNSQQAAGANPVHLNKLAQGTLDIADQKPGSAGREAQQQHLQLRRPSTQEKQLQQQQQRPSTREREAEAAYVEASNADWLAHQAAMSAQYMATDFLRGTASSELRRAATQASQHAHLHPNPASPTHISPASSSSIPSQSPAFISGGGAGKPPPLAIPASLAAGRSPQISPFRLQASPRTAAKAKLAATAPPTLQQPGEDGGAGSEGQSPTSSPFAKAAFQAHADSAEQPALGWIGEGQPVRCKTPPFVKGRQPWMGGFEASPLLTHRESFVVEEHNNAVAVPGWDGPIPPGALAFDKAHCDQLCFLRRVEPQRTRLLTRLHVVADLLAATEAGKQLWVAHAWNSWLTWLTCMQYKSWQTELDSPSLELNH
eukprot:CAMPEP_0202398944 /NCGR_PEP_ID=MMETSP1128-20130828/1661_1 /ASSEMBLY_ACC=CAM_ASM_000463 /TAXON_ID=3047 /ORGANISM="Dunaliella tertiolecta, Strain CCMP1320" /LENGTH=878 /DNA_ID=CAMNT_0049002159 /DNA_START=400 /DNA_END=3035 /DNA_ORIENTATION=-